MFLVWTCSLSCLQVKGRALAWMRSLVQHLARGPEPVQLIRTREGAQVPKSCGGPNHDGPFMFWFWFQVGSHSTS